jgi:hypothetical protein
MRAATGEEEVKLRHVRGWAATGIALVALAGAAGCGKKSGGGDASPDSGTSKGTAASGGASGHRAAGDVTITRCGLDAGGRSLLAHITIDNPSAQKFEYRVTIEFRGAPGAKEVRTAFADVVALVKANGTAAANATTVYAGANNGTEYTCEVASATRKSV